MEPKRLFDSIDYQLKHFPKDDMLVAKENGTWKKYSTQQVKDTVGQFSAGLISLGLSKNDGTPEGVDKVAIISNNRPEWVFTDLACQQLGLGFCPIYPTTNPLELFFILNDAQAKYIFVSSHDLYEKIVALKANVPSLKTIY